jgi:anti-sigma B factor antagonist
MRPFRVSEVDLDAGCREVRVEGELDLAVADQLRERLDAAIQDDVDVVVCLERCDFIDSTGIAVIVRAHKEMAEKGRRLAIANPSDPVSRILEITGLDRDGLLYATTDAALADRSGDGVA